MTRDDMIKAAEAAEREAQSLIDRYGTGTRPSWVSCDLAMAQDRARRYREEAEKLNFLSGTP